MDVEASPSKEEDDEEDDTMQNTVVLFSNTDKFVLLQVRYISSNSWGSACVQFSKTLTIKTNLSLLFFNW